MTSKEDMTTKVIFYNNCTIAFMILHLNPNYNAKLKQILHIINLNQLKLVGSFKHSQEKIFLYKYEEKLIAIKHHHQ